MGLDSLTIGIDARAAVEVPAGRGRVVRELLRALAERQDAHRYVLYARQSWDYGFDDRFEWVIIQSKDPWWHVRVARDANRRCDVFLSTNSYLTVPLMRVPVVAVVYDLIPFDPGLLPNRRSVIVERLTLGPAVRRAAGLIAISQATAEALTARFPQAASRVTVALLGVSPMLDEVPEGPGEPEQKRTMLPHPGFVLAVGTLEPRKNLPRLVDAYRGLPSGVRAAHPLVVVGPDGWQTGPTLAALDSLGPQCTKLGAVSDATLAELYRRCAVFCYPSLGEGFGLPVLEAMAAGAAVVTSDISSLPEVGGDAVAYADPRSVESIRDGILGVIRDEARQACLRRAARERASEFSWESFAATVTDVLAEPAGPRSRGLG